MRIANHLVAFAALAIIGIAVGPPTAHAGGVVALADARVSQYKDALVAAREVAPSVPVVDVGAGDAADQLQRLDPAVVLAIGQKALQVARAATPERPIVFAMVLGAGAAPSRTVTGVRLEVPANVQLEQLRHVAPSVKRIGVIYNPKTSGAFIEEALKAAGRVGLTLVSRPVTDPKEVRPALSDIAGAIDALWLMADPRLVTAEMFNFLLGFTLERKIALFGFLDSFTQAGALASVAPDYQEIGRRAARLATEIANKPAGDRVPVPPPQDSPGALTVNMKTAKQLGVDVPSAVLSKARQVYR
jgi:putative ABC transport system substrate-binding protein